MGSVAFSRSLKNAYSIDCGKDCFDFLSQVLYASSRMRVGVAFCFKTRENQHVSVVTSGRVAFEDVLGNGKLSLYRQREPTHSFEKRRECFLRRRSSPCFHNAFDTIRNGPLFHLTPNSYKMVKRALDQSRLDLKAPNGRGRYSKLAFTLTTKR